MLDSSSSLPSSSSSSSSGVAAASDLPCSILIDILGRLPLKTLINCRYVCKSWKSLLAESYFFRLYSRNLPTTLILQVKGTSLAALKQISLVEQHTVVVGGGEGRGSSLMRKMRLTSNPHKLRVDRNDYGGGIPSNFRFQLGNGCNGLICLRELRTREPSLVWNPIMGQFVILPKPATTADKVVAGFGFCGRTNRYKVVRIFHMKRDPLSRRRVEIYDLGVGNEWRRIGDAPFPIPSRIPGFFTNNSLHWILDYNCKENNLVNNNIDDHNNNNDNNNNTSSNFELICGFDFVEEKFKAISAPPIFSSEQRNNYHWSNLGIISNCLSICAIDAKVFRPDVQVWVMEEYGVPESWALRLSIRDPTVDWWDPYRWIQVTNFLSNGEILMLCAHCYVLAYNLRERRFRSVEGLDFPAVAHVPSFISLEDVLSEHHGTGSLNVRYL
ncbi:hypothetical protein SOVF_187610 [Spinacia oleracea]|nr:hypothetical protein SOVF_187610 [Spinacia oleracea]